MIGFFEEKEGQKSITRVNTSMLIWAGIFIALLTVSFYAIKVALTNPVDSLRYE